MAAVAIIGTLATIFGHDLIHRFTRWVSWAGGLAIFACFAWILGHHPDFAAAPASRTTVGAMPGAISTSVLWQIAYATYVSDYSRYLPAETGSAPHS